MDGLVCSESTLWTPPTCGGLVILFRSPSSGKLRSSILGQYETGFTYYHAHTTFERRLRDYILEIYLDLDRTVWDK